MIKIYFTTFEMEMAPDVRSRYIRLLPPELQEKNNAYRRWQDREAHLLGKLLTLQSLGEWGVEDNPLEVIRYDISGRPYIPGGINFNVSHSGKYVVCATSADVEIGIDIEEHTAIEFDDYKNVMIKRQWLDIEASAYPVGRFFDYWTMKEAVAKADGRGLGALLSKIDIEDNIAICEDKRWYLQSLNFDRYCSAHYASKTKANLVTVRRIDF